MTLAPPRWNSQMSQADFWGKKDITSMARSLRLAVVQNVFDQSLITKEQAKKILSGSLKKGDSSTVYDDSECLRVN
jgi:hypothetical protein